MKIEKILVPASGLKDVETMAEIALNIARMHQASVTALYVIEIPMNLPQDAQVFEEKEKGDDITGRIKQMGEENGVLVNTKVVNARKVANAILEEAQFGKYDLIMLGVSSRKIFKRLLFGDVVNEVVKKSSCMVCVVKGSQ